MIVCVCHRVSDAQITRHVTAGCRSFEELQDDLRVGTGCGACLDCAKSTFASALGTCAGGCAGESRGAPPRARAEPALAAA